jgi:hypothetical protein
MLSAAGLQPFIWWSHGVPFRDLLTQPEVKTQDMVMLREGHVAPPIPMFLSRHPFGLRRNPPSAPLKCQNPAVSRRMSHEIPPK